MRAKLAIAALLVAILCVGGTTAAFADCPANSAPFATTQEGDTTVVHCRCVAGFVFEGGQCRAAPRAPATVRPGAMVTPALFEAALNDCRRLAHSRDLLRNKIEQLRGWRDDTRRYQGEFEALRADALRGVFSDALDAVPADAIARQATATKEAAAQLLAAFDAVQGVVSEAEGIIEPEQAERFKKIAEGELAIRKSLLDIPLAHETRATRKWVENFGNVYATGVKLTAYALDRRSGKTPLLSLDTLSKTGELTGEIVGLYYPGVRISVALTKLGVRGAQLFTARHAIGEFGNVLAQNWNAERHLADKIRQLSGFITEETRTIDAYRGVHPAAASCSAG